MKLARPATAVIVGWTVVLLLIAAFASVLLNDRWQNAQALPLMFWTLFSVLVLVAIACAIGLPSEKAAFWRTWVLVLAACLYDNYTTYGFLEEMPLPDAVEIWLIDFIADDEWVGEVLSALAAVTLSTVAGTIAALLRRRMAPTISRVFHFRIVHLFALSTVVALSCWAVNATAEPRTDDYCSLALLIARVVAAVLVGAGWGHAPFLMGFLAGSFASEWLISRQSLTYEWEALWGIETGRARGLVSIRFYRVLWPLLSLYAGLFTGILAAMLYRPPTQPAAQEAKPSDP